MNRLTALSLLALIGMGCGGSGPKGPDLVPVRGVVRVNGQPAVGARVTFSPNDPKINPAGGVAGPDGSYELRYGSKSGAPKGDYKVTVNYLTLPDGKSYQPKEGELDVDQLRIQGKVIEALPPKYSDPTKTELTYAVRDGGSSSADFELNRN